MWRLSYVKKLVDRKQNFCKTSWPVTEHHFSGHAKRFTDWIRFASPSNNKYKTTRTGFEANSKKKTSNTTDCLTSAYEIVCIHVTWKLQLKDGAKISNMTWIIAFKFPYLYQSTCLRYVFFSMGFNDLHIFISFCIIPDTSLNIFIL